MIRVQNLGSLIGSAGADVFRCSENELLKFSSNPFSIVGVIQFNFIATFHTPPSGSLHLHALKTGQLLYTFPLDVGTFAVYSTTVSNELISKSLLVSNDCLFYINLFQNVMHLHDLKTGQRLYTFPLDVGTIVGFSGKKKYNEIFYSFMSFLQPTIIFHCSIPEIVVPNTKLETKVFREIKVKDFDPSLFETKQVRCIIWII